jgi:purine-binding chemotaxis protein CheW
MTMKDLRADPIISGILEARARELALEETIAATELGEELLTFRLGGDGYSLSARFVREVQPLTGWTPLPSTPPCIVGLVNVRGRLLTALDIRPLLDIAWTPPQTGAFLVIVSAQGLEMALLADQIDEVRNGDANLATTLATKTGRGRAWIGGVDRDLRLKLDPEALLADPRLLAI